MRPARFKDKAPEIRELLKQGVTHSEIARRFDMRRGSVAMIASNRMYPCDKWQEYLDAKRRSERAFKEIGTVLMHQMAATRATELLNAMMQQERFTVNQLKKLMPDEKREHYRKYGNRNIRGSYLTWKAKQELRGETEMRIGA